MANFQAAVERFQAEIKAIKFTSISTDGAEGFIRRDGERDLPCTLCSLKGETGSDGVVFLTDLVPLPLSTEAQVLVNRFVAQASPSLLRLVGGTLLENHNTHVLQCGNLLITMFDDVSEVQARYLFSKNLRLQGTLAIAFQRMLQGLWPVENAVAYVVDHVEAQVEEAETLRFEELLEAFDSLYLDKLRADSVDENTISSMRIGFANKWI